jgi:hypothetical protein
MVLLAERASKKTAFRSSVRCLLFDTPLDLIDHHINKNDFPDKFSYRTAMRLFTPEEANAILPEVRRLFAGIDRARETLRRMAPDAKRASENPGGGGVARGFQYSDALASFIAATQEILSLGVEIKDFDQGLLDFPSERDGKIVYLCWRRGEESIEWWHDLDAGFAGRRRIED